MAEIQNQEKRNSSGDESDLSNASMPSLFSRLRSPVAIGAAIGISIGLIGHRIGRHFQDHSKAGSASANWNLPGGTTVIMGDRTEIGPFTVPFTPPPLRYSVSAKAPYQIRDPILDAHNREYTNGPTIAILDNAGELVLQRDKANAFVSSHYECIRSIICDGTFRTVAFDASGGGASLDSSKISNILSHISSTAGTNGIGVLNCSFYSGISIAELEQLRNLHPDSAFQSAPPFTKENLIERTSEIRTLAEYFSAAKDSRINADLTSRLATAVPLAPLFEEVIAKGIAVVKCAGNSGPDNVDLIGSMVKDIIVVAGADQTGHRFDPNSSASSLIDTTRYYDVPVFYGTWSISIQGSSFATANVSGEVASMKEQGQSIKEISEEFRRNQVEWEQENRGKQ